MDTKEIFEQLAARYDSAERLRMAGVIAAEIQRELAGMHGGRAMDYGCATGLVGLELLGQFDSMLFVDLSPQMIAQVEHKLAQAHIASAAALCCDFCEGLPPGLQADVVIVTQTLLHVKEYELLLARLYEVLDKNGLLLVVDFDYNDSIQSDKIHPGFDQAELCAAVRRAGFSSAEAHTFYHGERLLMNQAASMFLLKAAKGTV